MCTLILPFIINLLLILYCIYNVNNKYNIIYILWVILALMPVLNYLSVIAIPWYLLDAKDRYGDSRFSLKPTKLNKFLFGYEERED